MTWRAGAPIGYYSLELLLSYEVSTPAEEQLKAEERQLSRRAAFVVVQDEGRARLLVDDNDWPGIAWFWCRTPRLDRLVDSPQVTGMLALVTCPPKRG